MLHVRRKHGRLLPKYDSRAINWRKKVGHTTERRFESRTRWPLWACGRVVYLLSLALYQLSARLSTRQNDSLAVLELSAAYLLLPCSSSVSVTYAPSVFACLRVCVAS